ncbi:MAG: tetratricopeptide repeat protein, partial [Cyanobacteria bacterium RM1_2_2]|nr:tetratricopeptide repeat protein [Cyanobacteria bacterium RM1_2_2]
MAQISVFRRAFNVTAAAALVPDTQIAESDLRQLVRRSLLQELPRDKTDQRQFQLQPQVRELVQQRAGDLTAAHERAIEYYWTIAQPKPWQELDDVAEYLEIFHHYCELQQYAEALSTLWGSDCDSFLELRGYNLERTQLYQPLVVKWQPTDAKREGFGTMLNRLGIAYRCLAQYQQAIEFQQQSLDIARQIGYGQGEAASLINLGNAYDSLGQYQQAIEFY